MGDWNINLLNIENHEASQEFFDVMMSNSLVPTITKPTRVTHKSATLIDNIFCNSLFENDRLYSGILYTDITDHLPIFHIDYTNKKETAAQYIKKRSYSDANVSNFKDLLSAQDWSIVYDLSDPQEAYSKFHEIYSNLYNTAFPLKKRKSWI